MQSTKNMSIKIRRKDGKTMSFPAKHYPNASEALKAFKDIHSQSIHAEGWEILEPKEDK